MDHLPLPQDAAPFIIAPYEAPSDLCFVEGTISPKKTIWIKNGLKSKGSNYEVDQFFQTWLFFGLLIEVMKIGEVHVSTEDFLRQRGEIKAKIVDTSTLPRLLMQWKKGVRSRWDLADAWAKLNEMFEKTAAVLDRYCVQNNDARPLNLDKPRPWPVRDEISTTMIALAYSLRRAAIDVCEVAGDMDGLSLWPKAQSEILSRRLRQKWCVADITTLLNQLSIDGQYYMASSPGLHADELDHHSKCIKPHCLYDYDLNFYVTRHADSRYHKDPCQNEINYGGQLGPERGQKDWVDAMHRIIDKDAIPIALWLKGPKQLWSVEYHLSGNRKPAYVAISHVWSDGKGNPSANSLPECQLDKIMRLVEKVTWDGRKEIPSDPKLSDGVGFWMDTLCVPAKDKARKGKAILNMRHVYSNAKAVLVLDDWLEQIRSDAPVLDVVTRLYQSNWIKRLWTHQEGFLPPAVWIQFSDCSIELSILSKKVEDHQSSLKATGLSISDSRMQQA